MTIGSPRGSAGPRLARAFTAMALCAFGLMANAGAAQAPGLAGLSGLERGQWELRVRERGGRISHVCLGDPKMLLQPRHPGAQCRRYVVTDQPGHVVVTYDCGAAGNGRTDLRVETPRLAQISSQGIADSAPFEFALEARRVGECRPGR